MESINALLIAQGLAQSDRLIQLNKVAITQMKSLTESKVIKKLKWNVRKQRTAKSCFAKAGFRAFIKVKLYIQAWCIWIFILGMHTADFYFLQPHPPKVLFINPHPLPVQAELTKAITCPYYKKIRYESNEVWRHQRGQSRADATG